MPESLINLLIIGSNMLLAIVSIAGIVVSLRDAYHHDEKQNDTIERIAKAAIEAAHQDEMANRPDVPGPIPQGPATSPRRKAISPRKPVEPPAE